MIALAVVLVGAALVCYILLALGVAARVNLVYAAAALLTGALLALLFRGDLYVGVGP